MDIEKNTTDYCEIENNDKHISTSIVQREKSNVFLEKMMNCIIGPVKVVIDGKSTLYENGKLASMALSKDYELKAIVPKNNLIMVTFAKQQDIPNDVSAEWVREFKELTGEDISFF